MDEDAPTLVDEIEAIIRQAASGQKVVVIRLVVGKKVSVSKVSLARELRLRFPSSSLEIKENKDRKNADSVIVKNIEVE
ncbi:MAG: hypothetical protein N3G22_03405 [Candidatus Micrarchaeota archaeon]|nr:hypothetical protein [Candidatus Micrarchaeota archaeon]